MPADRALVVSPRKSGTHLVQELMIHLGYDIFGESIPAIDHAVSLSLRQRIELADRYVHPDVRGTLDPQRDRDAFVRTTNALWWQITAMWEKRLAAVNVSYGDLAYPDLESSVRLHPQAWTTPFAATPAGVCWIFHSMDIHRVDRRFLYEWQVDWTPRVVVNYRDPRDALVSMARFLSGDSGHTFDRQPELAMFRPILGNLPSMADRITYLLRDRAIPLLSDFDAVAGLVRHPAVCAVAFEDLVGARGGGEDSRQIAAVRRAAEHVRADVEPAAVAEKLFNPNSYSFHRGQTGAWHDLFTRQHRLLFADRFGHLLEILEYA